MKENKEKDKNKKVVLTLLAVIFLLILVIGSTYSYYNLGVDTSKAGKTTISGRTKAYASFTLTTPVADLYLYLSNQDMSLSNANKDYYATKTRDNKKETEVESATYQFAQVVGTNVSEGSKYVCTADVVVTFTNDDTLGNELQKEDLTLHLKTNTGEQDLDLSSVKNTNVTFTLNGPDSVYLEGYLMMHNKETNQKYLANKDINITVETKNLNCSADNTMTGLELAKKGSKGLKETPNAGDLAYRYVGTQEEDIQGNIKNYLCFGDENCSDGPTDVHMYRIIGITAEGQLKIQKNSAIGTSDWWTDNATNKLWKDSKIYTETLKSFYEDGTYVSQDMKSKIEEHTWNTGDVQSHSDGTTVYNAEQGTSSHKGNYGLAYLSDYYFAYDEQGTTNCGSSRPDYCKSWMIPTDTTKLWSNKKVEWTMSRYGQYSSSYYAALGMYSSGNFNIYTLDSDEYAVRPVFYLIKDVKIVSGSGTSDDPYILEDPNKKGTELAQEKFNGEIPEGFKTFLTGDMYRFVGNQDEDKENNVNNYVCFGSTDNCGEKATDNHMYRIIGITEQGNLKIQKNKALESTPQWWTDYSTDKLWKDSKIYTETLNNFYNDESTYVTSTMKSKIDTIHKWNIGDVSSIDSSIIGTGDTVYNLEQAKTHTGAVGLAYLSDYYFAYSETGNTNCYGNSPDYCKSWMIPNENDYKTLWSSQSYEWTMTRYGRNSSGSSYYAWNVISNGQSDWNYLYNTYAVRPVFYLIPEVTLTTQENNQNPKGSLENPWIVELN